MDDYKKLDIAIALNDSRRKQINTHTNGHGERVGDLCARLAKYIGLEKEIVKQKKYSGFTHDFGKQSVPVYILEKHDKLNPSEWAIIQMHPQWGYENLEALKLKDNTIALDVLYHHVNYDGTGYPPVHFKEQDIPLGARMLGITDRYDALTSDRIYRAMIRNAMTPRQALRQLAREAAKLDPELLAAFIEMIKADK